MSSSSQERKKSDFDRNFISQVISSLLSEVQVLKQEIKWMEGTVESVCAVCCMLAVFLSLLAVAVVITIHSATVTC